MNRIKCFFLTETDQEYRYLRRFVLGSAETHYHDAKVRIGQFQKDGSPIGDVHPHDDERWPTHCKCGYEFKEEDRWQLFKEDIYRIWDTSTLVTLKEAEPGAMWYADFYPFKGPDGHSLVVKTPGGIWCVDGRASNCTKPDDKNHRCWVRHGKVPNITVDKNGNTCSAGGGSIICGNFHGFLRNGYLEG